MTRCPYLYKTELARARAHAVVHMFEFLCIDKKYKIGFKLLHPLIDIWIYRIELNLWENPTIP